MRQQNQNRVNETVNKQRRYPVRIRKNPDFYGVAK